MDFLKKAKLLLITVLIFTFVLSGVGSKDTYAATKVTLSKTSITLDQAGMYAISIKGTKEKVTWTSSNKNIATVTSTGKLTAKITAKTKAGNAVITAKVGKKTYTCKVKVNPISISYTSLRLTDGDSFNNLYVKGTKKQTTWSSSNSNVVSVYSTGRNTAHIKANNEGKAVISAWTGSELVQCTIEVSAPNISYISDREVSYYSESNLHRVFFSMLDDNKQRTYANMKVDIKIINTNDETVYEKTHNITKDDFSNWTSTLKGSQYLASIAIPQSAITKGSSKSGKIYVTVSGQKASFDEYSLSINNLPYESPVEKSSLYIPSPITVLNNYSYNGSINGKVSLTNITYKFEESYDNKVKLTVYFEGERLRAASDNATAKYLKISHKLLKDGYVVDSGTIYTPTLSVGDKFKNVSETFYSLEPGNYVLELYNTTY